MPSPSKAIIDSFILESTKPGPSLQAMIGTRIAFFPWMRRMHVPTTHGIVSANPGDRIVLYDDGTLEVEYGKD